jgi:hypothetical protein
MFVAFVFLLFNVTGCMDIHDDDDDDDDDDD